MLSAKTIPISDAPCPVFNNGFPDADRLANMVVAALITEVTLTPKPGLVDMRSRGAHKDLSWRLMCDSATSLHPTFVAMAYAGASIKDTQQLRQEIGSLGRAGEACMLHVTNGINTHRGAIWALGLLVTAAASLLQDFPENARVLTPTMIANHAGALARCQDLAAPDSSANKGAQACQLYGVGGARAQAQANFPHVIEVALPLLYTYRRNGHEESTACINALLGLIALLDDTCILSRGGISALHAVQSGAAEIIEAGGVSSTIGKQKLYQFEHMLLTRHVSPGGAADLLAATLFLDQLDHTLQASSVTK